MSFTRADIATPTGDSVLIQDLSIRICPGEHLMITGANGSGKTSILRVLAGIWPQFSGTITRPDTDHIFYVPQRPYLAIGTLREQVIYPHSVQQMKDAGRTDEELMEILKIVYLDYIPSREGGWDAVKEWKDVFSGGVYLMLVELCHSLTHSFINTACLLKVKSRGCSLPVFFITSPNLPCWMKQLLPSLPM